LLLPYHTYGLLEAGCDEAGRGCLAGPVFAAAVILPEGFDGLELNDSKQLNEKTRTRLREQIEREAISWAVARVEAAEIDQINILQASFLAMHRAVNALVKPPELLLIDGNRFKKHPEIPHVCIVKGDSKYQSIAAASILAKTWRDEYMLQLHEAHPQYGWSDNKGYPTAVHREALARHGTTEHHRLSFQLLKMEG
jgi:ribonuclease HII